MVQETASHHSYGRSDILRQKQEKLDRLREQAKLRKERSTAKLQTGTSVRVTPESPQPKAQDDEPPKAIAPRAEEDQPKTSRKSDQLKEKLRQKEAQLAALRKRTLLRKRVFEERASSDDEGSVAASPSAEERAIERMKHQENIKRLRMMTEKKRQDLARYRSRFANREATEAC